MTRSCSTNRVLAVLLDLAGALSCKRRKNDIGGLILLLFISIAGGRCRCFASGDAASFHFSPFSIFGGPKIYILTSLESSTLIEPALLV
jgi:hypothetical protein